VRIEGGAFTALLPNVPLQWDDPTTFSTRGFSAAPTGRELDLRLTTSKDMGPWGALQLQALAAFDQGNMPTNTVGYGLMGGWRVKF
jgi:hypothetical protein